MSYGEFLHELSYEQSFMNCPIGSSFIKKPMGKSLALFRIPRGDKRGDRIQPAA